ncbi:MAG TPA: hypothetical protein VM055_00310 [Novosphingobium sp.]|nr:hypothetical protein [Novosphingobium sp.]
MTKTETPREPARPAPPAAGLFGGGRQGEAELEPLRNAAGREVLSAAQRNGFAELFRDEGGTLHPA